MKKTLGKCAVQYGAPRLIRKLTKPTALSSPMRVDSRFCKNTWVQIFEGDSAPLSTAKHKMSQEKIAF